MIVALGGYAPTGYTDGRAPQGPNAALCQEVTGRTERLNWKQLLFDVIDMRSFSNLWYWIALAVTWSRASHWIIGIPYDMVLRARRGGEGAVQDLDDIARIYVGRLTYIAREAGLVLVAIAFFLLTVLALLGFVYGVEFCQAVFLLLFPVSVVGVLSFRAAHRIETDGATGVALVGHLQRQRIATQVIGFLAIFVTAFWGMFQNFSLSVLG